MDTKRSHARSYAAFVLSLTLSFAVAAMISCGGSTMSSSNPTTGTVKTYLSDPPTCSNMPYGFANVYVTITKVEANLSSDAGPNDSGWQTLADLTNEPTQVDLMTLNPSATPGFCGTLYMLAQKQLPPGKYQQIRLILLANNASSGPSSNACGSAGFNCVVPEDSSGNPLSPVELQLSSQAQTGIKIPASQITDGGLTVTAGQNTDLNIDFDSCASIVREGNGQYRFKPVLHAGEVSVNNSVISGKVVEASTSPNPGSAVADALVLLEQANSSDSSTDRVVRSAVTGADGSFSFCPMPASNTNFDVVVTGQTTESGTITTTTTYNPTVLFGVPIGSDVGNIPIYAETATGSGTGLVSTSPAMISGQITTANSGAVAGTVQVSALQQVSHGGSNINLTIPVFQAGAQPPNFTTTTGSSCPTGTDCSAYSLMVPASSPAMADYSSSSISYTAPSSSDQATYTVNAVADGTDGLLTCSPTAMTSNSFTVKSGDTASSSGTPIVMVPTLDFAFTGCTAP